MITPYEVMYYHPESPVELERFLMTMHEDGYKLLSAAGDYYIFERMDKDE